MTCPCASCRNIGPDHEADRALPPGPRPGRSHIPPPPETWWQRVESAARVNRPDDPQLYEWPTRKVREDAKQ